MSEIPQAVRALIGVRKTRRCTVTARDIHRFAQAIGVSPETRGGVLVAPPLFCQSLTFEELPLEQLPPDGSPSELDVPVPARRAVGGGSQYVIYRLVRAGEVITVESQLKDVSNRQGRSGPLYLLVVETRFTGEDGRPVATEVATYLKRP